jgi:hypothetical protein
LAPFGLFVACLVILGCGGKPTGDLSGSVTYKGKSVVHGTVTVYDTEGKPYQGGIDQGKYTVKNVPEGAVHIIVMSPDPGPAGTGAETPDGRGRPGREKRDVGPVGGQITGWFPLPKKYEDPNNTPFKTTVKAGMNPYDLELKD